MGVNLREIVLIVHYGVPTTATEFMQETGRAGREGGECHSLLLTYPRMNSGRKVTTAMKSYASASTCLRKILLAEFGGVMPTEPIVQCCNVCNGASALASRLSVFALCKFSAMATDDVSDLESDEDECDF